MDRELLSEDELDHLLLAGDPVTRNATDDPSVRAALTSFRRSVESGASGTGSARSASRSVYRRRWATLGVAVAVVVAASLVGVETLTGGAGSMGLPLEVPPASAAQLNKLARAAGEGAIPRTGQWEYLAFKVEQTGTATVAGSTIEYTATETQQAWEAADGTIRHRVVGSGFSLPTSQAEADYLANKAAFDRQLGHDPTGVLQDKTIPEAQRSFPVWETHPPTDPQTLLTEIWAGHARSSDPRTLRPSFLWNQLSGILLSSTSSQLRATAYKALSYVPDTRVLGPQTVTLGISGVAIAFTGASGVEETLIASPTTGNLLQLGQTLTRGRGGLPAGTVEERWIFLQRGIVGSSTALPGGGIQPLASNSQTS